MLTQEPKLSDLTAAWQSCGVASGDTLLIHSSVKRTLQDFQTTPAGVMQSFLDAVGPNGTVIFPLFNFDFTKGVPFDIRGTPSQMGALTEAARAHPDTVRSGHPIYSFAAIGKNASKFDVDNRSAYGVDSPFAILRDLDAKIGVLDLEDVNSMTFYHHVEEMHKVPYRYMKDFTAPYTDKQGSTEERTYSIYVRDLDMGVVTDVNPMSEILWEKGLYQGCRPKLGGGLRTINSNAMYDAVSECIREGKAQGLLYSIHKP